MPQLDFDGANSKISADTIRGQSGTTVTVQSGHNLVGSGSGLTALPAANLTGTLPAIDGSNLTGVSGGKVLQVVTDIHTARESTTSTTKAEVDANWSATITPAATSSKVLIQMMWNSNIGNASNNLHYAMTVYRDSTDLDPTAGESWQAGLWNVYSVTTSQWWTHHLTFLDSPNTTSAVVYKPYWWVESGGSWLLGSMNSTTLSYSQLHLFEIGA